jgi:hypothetical protein
MSISIRDILIYSTFEMRGSWNWIPLDGWSSLFSVWIRVRCGYWTKLLPDEEGSRSSNGRYGVKSLNLLPRQLVFFSNILEKFTFIHIFGLHSWIANWYWHSWDFMCSGMCSLFFYKKLCRCIHKFLTQAKVQTITFIRKTSLLN